MVVVVHKIADEESHCCAGQRVGGGVSSSANPRHAHRRREAVRENRIDLPFRKFPSGYPGKCPRLYRVAGRERVAAFKKRYRLTFDFRSRPLSNEFEDLDRDLSISEGLDSDSPSIPRTRVVTCLTNQVERS